MVFALSANAHNTTLTAQGDGITQINGENNSVNSHYNASSAHNTRTTNSHNSTSTRNHCYYNKQAVQDLKLGNYKIHFEDTPTLNKPRKRVLILTATNLETGILHDEAQRIGVGINKAIYKEQIVYEFGTIGGVDVFHIQAGTMGMLEPGSTPLILMSVFQDIQPDYLIDTGIAFGRQSKGQKLGDILVSRQIVNYESRKTQDNRIIFRGDKVTSNLLSRINSGIHNWKGVTVHQGLVLCGNVLANSKQFLASLEEREPEYVGGEMESFGVYAVASMMNAKWIMIKGISDWGDGTKNDVSHAQALHNVAQFILHVVKDCNLK